MSIFVIGINHQTAPITLREKIYFSADKLALYLQDLLNRGDAYAAVLLSTCNRSELYCATDNIHAITDWFYAQAAIPRQILSASVYSYHDVAAVAHIMQVACGLNSMVLGESQILGQMKEAFSESCVAGAVDSLFHHLFQQVFAVAKEIRATTAIGACPVSLASAAIHFIKQQVPTFAQANITLIGTGSTTELLLRHLTQHIAKPMTLVSRHPEKAQQFIQACGGLVCGFNQLTAALARADIVFSATGSVSPIIDQAMLWQAMQAREKRPIILMDLAVPRDIDPAVLELANVALYCLDDLKSMIEKNRLGREHAADKAREMINKKSHAFMTEVISMDKVSHTIRAYRGRVEELCHSELIKAKQQLHLGAEPMQVLDAFAHAFIQKLLHTPSVQLRQAGVEGRLELLHLAKQLFAIPDAIADRESELS